MLLAIQRHAVFAISHVPLVAAVSGHSRDTRMARCRVPVTFEMSRCGNENTCRKSVQLACWR